jgi:formyl-CoA transferase
MEASFALLESAVPEYDRLGLVREPAGTRLKGIAPSNIFRSRAELWMVIAANQDGVFRRLCDAMGRPELAEWAACHGAREIDSILNVAGVVCGPIYTMAEIIEDPQYRAREMLVEHVDPEFGPYVGPGIVPKFSDTPGEVRWSGTWEEGSHNEEIYCGLLGLTDVELRGLKEDGVV